MKKRNAIVATVVVIAALVAVPLVYAQGRHHWMRASAEASGGEFPLLFGRMERIRTALDLSDAQVEQLKTIAAQLHEQNAAYRDQLRGGMQSVAQTLLTDPNNVAGAQAIIDQQAVARKAMATNMLNAASKALNALTPDQRGKLSTFLTTRAARMHGGEMR